MNKNLLIFKLALCCFGLVSTSAYSAIQRVDADPLPLCDSTLASAGHVIPGAGTASYAGQCRNTPTAYKIKVFEMGVCTAHPYGASKDSASFATASCEIGYRDASPAAVDIGASIGGAASSMGGTSSLPKNGTYTHAYLIFKNEFTVKGQITAANNAVYSSKAAGGGTCTIDARAGAGFTPEECTEKLTNFGGPNCFSGYVGATVVGGVIDGFIVGDNLARGDGTTDVTAGECDAAVSTKLVGVMTLGTPFAITPQTYGLNFKFNLTDQGIQWIEDGGTDGIPNGFSSAPFSGTFEVLNQD
ncbi:hypothetical protein N9X39_04185 [Alphaproteobacteria bacterium]|nr:hypothetical protein [Alphaproteobacteria bacterium]